MANAMLADFLVFNDLVAALARAGVIVHLGLPRRGAAEACDRIGAVVARRVGEGASVQEALRDSAVPEAYRCAAQLALITGDPEAVLGDAHVETPARGSVSRTMRASLRYPLLVCFLTYVGLVLFCLFMAPLLNDTYEIMEVPADWGLRVVNWLCLSMPYWLVAFPLLLLAFIGYRRWSQAKSDEPGGASSGVFDRQLARFAEMLAAYLEAGAAMPEALEAASTVWSDGVLKRAALDAAAALRRDESPGENEPLAKRLPPLLRWAVWRAEPIDRPQALQMVAEVYRRSAQSRGQRRAIVGPMLACVAIGGGATLLYALALFLPVTQLIQGLAR